MTPQRRKRNSSKVNFVISTIFHSLIVVALFFLAAREGYLGKNLKKIAVVMVPKEKPPEKPKEEKPPEQKAQPPKEEKATEVAKTTAPPPPPVAASTASPAAAATAPPPTISAAFDFSDGAKAVQSDATSDPTIVYKNFLEFTIKQKWNRPENLNDKSFVAEVELAVDKTGQVTASQWKKSSGHSQWDDSVRKAIAQTKALSRPPPKGFTEKFLVRFDVQTENEPLMSASLR